MKRIVVFLVFLINGSHLSGQSMDSISFNKASARKFELNRFQISKIKLKNKGISPATDDGIPTDEKVIEGIFTFLTGWGTSSSSESLWHLDNRVQLRGVEREFFFPVLVRGYYEKNRERVTNDDGSKSMETTEMHDLYWQEGANGDLVENGNSRGYFSFSVQALAHDSLQYWKEFLEKDTDWISRKLDSYGYYDQPQSFLVDIVYEDQPHTLLYHGDLFRYALIHQGQLIGLWQHTPTNVSKKKRIQPYLLLPQGISDAEAQRTIALLSLGITLTRNQGY